MERVVNKGKEGKPADLREQGLRILARIIARAYLSTVRTEKEKRDES